MNPDNAIELRDVSLTYSIESYDTDKKGILKKHKTKIKNTVLDRINLDVKKGEILGVIGINGSGKSTLLSIMARILEPDSGTVDINGKVATILELGMGFHPDLTGRENIVLKGELYGFSKKQMEEKTQEIIDYSGIQKYIDNPVRTYSSGMKSRLAFSIMINVDADILLVDEILSTGDAAFSAKASDYFKKILKNGKTVVYVSHSPGTVENICSRVIWIEKGKIIADGSPKKVCFQYHEAAIESLDVVIDQAKSGLSDAQYRLAMFYKDGIKVEKNVEAYVYWIGLAAEQGHIRAQVELADYLMKYEPEKSRELALSYYQYAASRGDAVARSKLSLMLGGDVARKDHSELKYIFKQLAEKGNPQEMFYYASFLFNTAWDESDREESYYWFKRVSDEYNHPDAILQLVYMYRDGVGVRKNKEEYLNMLKKGDSLDIIKASNMLADVYYSGIFVEKDDSRALKLYLKCAEMGSIPCQYTVATFYQDGIGTEPDLEKAKYWFEVYSKSQLIPYQLLAIKMLKSNYVANSTSIDALYSEISDSKDPKALIELYARICERPELYSNGLEMIAELMKKLSRNNGKGAAIAYPYYSRPDSVGYNPKVAQALALRSIHSSTPEQMFRLACDLLSNSNENSVNSLAIKYLKLSARNGCSEALSYCSERGIDINLD